MLNRTITTQEGAYTYRWSEILLVIAVFTKEIGTKNVFGIDFDFIGYPFFILYFLFNLTTIVLGNLQAKSLFAYLIISSLISIVLLNLSFDGFLKQMIPIIIIVSVTFIVLKSSNLQLVFLLYVKFTYWTAVFGIIQVILSYGGIFLYTLSVGRLDSIAYEPSHYAALLMPALIYTFMNFREYKKYFIVMLTALILTFNLTGYLVFLGLFTIATIHPLYILVTLPIAYITIVYVLPNFSDNFSIRFRDTYSFLSGNKDIFISRLKVNGTTLSFFSNFEVAKYALSNNFLFGAGLGGHEEMYLRRFENSAFVYNYYYGLNSKSAHSLIIRILSELGLVGFVLYIYLLVKNLLIKRGSIHYVIGVACVSHFLCKAFKLGGYIDYGTPFFFVVMILNYNEYKKMRKLEKDRKALEMLPEENITPPQPVLNEN